MTKRMLVDATHPEEIRVAIVQDNRLSDLDIETSSREQIKGNIYLARVSRVEPSLQAAFVDFGGGRQGFLSVNDIHVKYYPSDEKGEREDYIPLPLPEPTDDDEDEEYDDEEYDDEENEEDEKEADAGKIVSIEVVSQEPEDQDGSVDPEDLEGPVDPEDLEETEETESNEQNEEMPTCEIVAVQTSLADGEVVTDEEMDDDGSPLLDTFKRFPRRQRLPIQNILTRGQKLLVQVVKESRGNKGASLTTNLSLAGRYAVLLPENEGGGGISRKITDTVERKKLKEILETISIPGQVSLIIRTAGLGRTKREIIRDLNYLLRLWKKILENAAHIEGPALIHEEGDLIMRTIRDLYATDMTEILIEGQEGYRRGKDFMKLLMPRFMKVVQPYKEPQPIFSRFQIENQIESMHERVIQLKAGGYIIIEPTEAMVTIDINSGRSTREKDVEMTAYKTNLQATEEIARQLRLRDLGGLVVIDFIDMEDKKHNLDVERQMREALKLDRAKIQLGKISQFGLLELSRQRMKPNFSETNRQECPRCKGLGTIRSVESAAIHQFRMLEEDVAKNRYSRIVYRTSMDVANYLLNHKRGQLMALEAASNTVLLIQGDDTLQTPDSRVERFDRNKSTTLEPTQATVVHSSPKEPSPPPRAKAVVAAPSLPRPPRPPTSQTSKVPVAQVEVNPPDGEEEEGSGASVTAVVEIKKRRRRRRRKPSQTAVLQNQNPTVEGEESLEPLIQGVQSTDAPGLFILSQPDDETVVTEEASPQSDLEGTTPPLTPEVKPRPRRRRRRRSVGPLRRIGTEGGLPEGESPLATDGEAAVQTVGAPAQSSEPDMSPPWDE